MKYMAAVVLLFLSSVAYADLCAVGRIAEINEGWGDKESLHIKMDYSVSGAQQPPAGRILLPDQLDNDQTFWLKFNVDNLDADRLKRIRTLAYLALANDNTVKMVSRWNGDYSCLNLSQIVIINTQIEPNT